MKEDGAVRQQYKQVKFRRARKRLLENNFKRVCSRCCFSARISLEDDYKAGLCLYRDMADDLEWEVDLCDLRQVSNCPNFTPHATAEELKERFDRFMEIAESGDPQAMGMLALFYPDLAALLWVSEPWADNTDSEEESLAEKEAVDSGEDDVDDAEDQSGTIPNSAPLELVEAGKFEDQSDIVPDVPSAELADAVEKALQQDPSPPLPPPEVRIFQVPGSPLQNLSPPVLRPATMATLVVLFVVFLCFLAWVW